MAGETDQHSFEALVVSDREAERFNTAVFRYLELNTRLDDDRTATICSFPEPGFRRQTVTLWSAAAAADFAAFWRRFKSTARPAALNAARDDPGRFV